MAVTTNQPYCRQPFRQLLSVVVRTSDELQTRRLNNHQMATVNTSRERTPVDLSFLFSGGE